MRPHLIVAVLTLRLAHLATADEPAEPPADAAKKPDDVPGANLHIDSVSVDGVQLKDVACKTSGGGFGGLFGSLAIGAGFKERKAKLQACAPKAVESRVAWKSANNRMTDLHVTGNSPAINRCVERALAGAPSTVAGVCAATVVHGGR